MEYFTTTSAASRRAVDCVIVGIYERGKLGAGAADIDAASRGVIKRQVKSGDVSAAPGKCTILRDVPGVKAPRVAVVGLGAVSKFDAARYRKALTAALKAISSTKCRQVLNTLTLEDAGGARPYYLARFTAQAVGDALYRFTAMKSKPDDKSPAQKSLGLAASPAQAKQVRQGIQHGDAIGKGVSVSREVGNLPHSMELVPHHPGQDRGPL